MLLAPFFRGLARHLHLACFALTAATSAVFAQTNTPSAADGFDPNVDGTVYALLTQVADGKIIVVGQFANVQPNGGGKVARNNIARFNADGTLDATFDPNTNGAIRAVALQDGGKKIIIGGDFSTVGGSAHSCVARLNADGSVDESFTATIGKSLNAAVALPTAPQVYALAVQDSDGAVVVGGTFGSASSAGVSAVQRNNLARFTATGALDTTYDPNPNAIVLALALHQNDAVIVGGGFTQLQPAGSSTATQRVHVARVNKDGTLDAVFAPSTDNGVTTIAVQRDAKVLLGGYFTTVRGVGADSAVGRNYIARLNADGSLDSSFTSNIGGNVMAIKVSADGGILVGGHFNQIYSGVGVLSAHSNIARLGLDGAADDTFNPNVNGDVNAIAVQADGKVVIGGLFTRAISSGSSTQVVRNHVARLQPSGALDNTFEFESSGRILTSVTTSDGKIIVGGSFITIGGVSRNFLARLNADGSVDSTFNPDPNGAVYAMAYDKANNKILIGGSFTAIGPVVSQVTRNHIARLNVTDGSLDSGFDPNLNGNVGVIVLQGDSSILVGGSFTAAQPATTTTAVARLHLLKLSSDGQVDATFNPSASGTVTSIAVQTDGKLLVGGAFTYLQPGATGNAIYRNFFARLNPDGTVDSTYNVQTNGQINVILLDSANKATIAGQFTQILPHGATAPVIRNKMARLNADGTLDTTFDPNFDPNADATAPAANAGEAVLVLAQQSDGKIIAGGTFNRLQPNGQTTATTARYVVRLKSDGTVDPSFNPDLNEQTGSRVDYVSIQPSGDFLVGGTFISVKDANGNRLIRTHLAKFSVAGTLDTTFDLHPSGSTNTVKAIAVQGDGKIIVGGTFSDMGVAAGPNIARFNPEGTPDAVFNAALSTDGAVNAIAVRPTGLTHPTQLNGFAWLDANGTLRQSFAPNFQIKGHVNASVILPDNSVIIAGVFTDSTGATSGNIIKMSPTGQLDTTYNPNVNGIYGMFLVPDTNQLIIYGNFTTVGGVGQNYIARLNANGTLDTSFNPNPSATVNTATRLSDGSIVFGGLFTSVTQGADTTTTVTRDYIAKVDRTGKIDATFNPNVNNSVYSIVQQKDGMILVGGTFTAAQPNTDTTATTRNHIARFKTDGTLDTSFDPNASDSVYAIAVQPGDQKIIIGGSFANVGGTPHLSIARLNTDGSVDSSFTPAANGTVTSVVVSPDNSILLSGFFSTMKESGGSTIVTRSGLARLDANGKLLTSFNPSLQGQIAAPTVASDNSVLVGGTFTSSYASATTIIGGSFNLVGGVSQPYLAQLNADGSVNAQFSGTPDKPVTALLALADGRFVAGGAFTKIGNSARNGIARFTNDGSLDSSFNPSITGPVTAIALQPDGALIVGVTGGTGLVRIDANGNLDGSFTSAVPFASAAAIAVQPDGKIIVGGPGSGVPSRIVRLNSDGSVDSTFPTVPVGTGASLDTLTLQTDGSIIVAGSFSTIGGKAINNLARLTSAGAVDTSFNPNVNGEVSAIALQSDGRLVLGGAFSAVGNLARFSLARIGNTAPAPQTLGVSDDGKTITWLRSGTAGEVIAVTFDYSTDGLTWTSLGAGTRIGTSSQWQKTGVSIPVTGNVYIRAHGIVPANSGQTTGVYDTTFLANLSAPVSSTSSIAAPVASATKWDGSHYVWTVNGSGIIRIADAFSSVTFASNNTVLIEGGSVGSGTTSAATARLADLATRGVVNAASPLISGFSIVGSASRQVLIRAAGPGLAPFGVTNYLKVPRLVLYNNAGDVIATNMGWDASLLADFTRVGAFPFTPGSTDAAFLVKLAPGNYTVQVTDAGNGNGGDTLIEIYDAGSLSDSSARLMNLSTRGTVAPGAALIGGLVVSGSSPKTLLVRGIGPGLTRYNVSGVLSDPTITVYDAAGAVVATNDNWSVSSTVAIPQADYAAAVSSAAARVGAFALDANSADAALVITLPAGSYTVQIGSAHGTSGAGMIEVYELP